MLYKILLYITVADLLLPFAEHEKSDFYGNLFLGFDLGFFYLFFFFENY